MSGVSTAISVYLTHGHLKGHRAAKTELLRSARLLAGEFGTKASLHSDAPSWWKFWESKGSVSFTVDGPADEELLKDRLVRALGRTKSGWLVWRADWEEI